VAHVGIIEDSGCIVSDRVQHPVSFRDPGRQDSLHTRGLCDPKLTAGAATTSKNNADVVVAAISKIDSLRLDINNKKHQEELLKSFSSFDLLRTLAVVPYLHLVTDDPKSKVHSSKEVAAIVFGKTEVHIQQGRSEIGPIIFVSTVNYLS
jgi:hypothetical protein